METLEHRSKTPINTGQKGNSVRKAVREGLDFARRFAQGFVSLEPDGFDSLERLLVAIAESPEVSPIEVVKTISELLCPDEHIGGIETRPRAENPDTRARLIYSRKYIGEQIRTHREAAGLTQTRLAKLAKIPQSHVCRLECGKHTPSHITINRIAKALKIKPSQIDPGRSDSSAE
jgi:DNA-binding XRE family transcriptional regulator